MADIRHYLLIKAPVEKVYRAITEPEGLAGWWTPEVKASPEVGFVNEFRFGNDYFPKMEVVRLEMNKRMDWDCLEGDREWVGTHLSFELEDKDGKTGLLFTHAGWKDSTLFFASCSFDWGFYLNSLRQLCTTGKGSPYPSKNQ